MKKLILKSALIAIVSAAPLVAYNVIADPFGVVRSDYSHLYVCPNERYAKMKIISESGGAIDSLVFGSSVVSQVPVATLNRLTGNRYYNMSYIAGMPADHLAVLRYLLEKKVRLKNVLVGLDLYSFRHVPEGLMDSRSRLYPEWAPARLKFFFDYLVEEPDSSIFYEIHFDGVEARYDFYTTGQYHYMRKEMQLKTEPAKHALRFLRPPLLAQEERISKTVKELGEIRDLCRRNGISLSFYLNPVTARWYLCDDMRFVKKARRALLGFGPYWDFTGVNTVSSDIFNFYDMVHYRPEVGEYIAECILGTGKGVPAGFGRLVTEKTIDDDERWFEKNFTEGKSKQDFTCYNAAK